MYVNVVNQHLQSNIGNKADAHAQRKQNQNTLLVTLGIESGLER